MAGHVCKESWSRCEAPSMLYDTVRNPNAKYVAPKPITSSVDTIESTQHRLNREMLNRFRSMGMQLPHDSFVAVVQVGKYVFLAIMLPPYLCLYGLPRWLVLTFLPQAFEMGKVASIAMGRYIAEMSKYIGDLMNGLLDQLLGDALRMTKHHAKNLWRHLTDITKKLSDFISGGAAYVKAQTTAFKDEFKRFSAQIFEKIRHGANEASAWASSKKDVAVAIISENASKAYQFLDQSIVTPAILWLAPPFVRLAKAIEAAKNATFEFAEKAKLKIQSVIDPITARVKDISEAAVKHAKKILDALVDPVITWLQAKKEAVEQALNKAWKGIVDPVSAAYKAAKAKVEETITSGFDAAKSFVLAAPMGFLQAARWTWGVAPEKTRQRMRRRKDAFKRFGSGTKNLAKGVVAGIKEIGLAAKRLATKSRQIGTNLAKQALRLLMWVIQQVMLLPQKLMGLIKGVGKILVHIFMRTLFVVRIMIAVLWAASLFGIFTVRRAASKLLG